MIAAYQAGIPANGKPVPDGAKMAKVHWIPKQNQFFPDATVPGELLNVDFMVKDSKRFADGGGWGYAVFDYNAVSDTFTPGTTAGTPPQGNDAKCGVRVPHGSEDERLRVHGVRKTVNCGRFEFSAWASWATSAVTSSRQRVLDAGVQYQSAPVPEHGCLDDCGWPSQRECC